MDAARVSSWIAHRVMARTRHGVHSPFVFQLIEQVLRSRPALPEHAPIEALRKELLHSDQVIAVHDLGAGSRALRAPSRRVADIARISLKPARQGQMLQRLVHWTGARHMLELGTCFGITTLYLARGNEAGSVTTIEGCPQTHRIALHQFEQLRQRNITAVLGSFEHALPEALRRMDRLDLAFMDGHHAEEPTMAYFEQCLAKAHDASVLVLDDIHWSQGMEAAWARIKSHPRVTVTIDLYDLGLVFLRSGQAKEHFRLRY